MPPTYRVVDDRYIHNAVVAAMDQLSDEEQQYEDDFDPNLQFVRAEFYYRPSLDRATQELALLLALEGRQPPQSDKDASWLQWLDEVTEELEWIRAHPPKWPNDPLCIHCRKTEPAGNGPPRGDGRPRDSIGIELRMHAGVGLAFTHAGNCPS